MKKTVAILIGMLSMLGGAVGVALATPGPNESNNHGLCTAYFNGSETGRSNKHKAGPFAALESAANARDGQDNDGDDQIDETDEVAEAVWNWCDDPANNPKGIGGQPEDPTNDTPEGNGKNGRGKG